MKTALNLVIYLAFGTFMYGVGYWSHDYDTKLDRALMRANLAACNYTQHGISDISWELVRIGRVPVGSAAFLSSRLNSRNNSNQLKACMTGLGYGG